MRIMVVSTQEIRLLCPGAHSSSELLKSFIENTPCTRKALYGGSKDRV